MQHEHYKSQQVKTRQRLCQAPVVATQTTNPRLASGNLTTSRRIPARTARIAFARLTTSTRSRLAFTMRCKACSSSCVTVRKGCTALMLVPSSSSAYLLSTLLASYLPTDPLVHQKLITDSRGAHLRSLLCGGLPPSRLHGARSSR